MAVDIVNRVAQLALCIVLTIAVLTMSISVFATDPTPSPTPIPTPIPDPLLEVTYAMAMEYIYSCMRAWGIDIEYNGYREFGEEISEYLTDMVFEYLDTLPSAYTISSWIAPWQASFDYWGNLRLNSSALDDIQSFVDWLTGYEGITSNSVVPINPIYNVGAYNMYRFGQPYECIGIDGSNQYWQLDLEYSNNNSGQYGNPDGYFMWLNSLNNKVWFVVISNTAYKVQILERLYNNNGWSGVGGGVITSTIEANGNLYYYYLMESYGVYMPNGASVFNGSQNELKQFMQTADIVSLGTLNYVTSNITLPDLDPNYTTGDSITIIQQQPQYDVIPWSDEVVVSNLPAVVSTGTVTNPGLVEFFRPISALIDIAKTPFDIMVQIIYRFPVEVNVCIMSLMGAICLFGIIKIMREH